LEYCSSRNRQKTILGADRHRTEREEPQCTEGGGRIAQPRTEQTPDMQPYEELFELAKRLNQAASVADSIGVTQPLEALENAANEVKRSFSGSWLGYHSDVYYAGLKPPPPRANFSQELGLKEMLGSLGSRGDWRQFDPEDVKAQIRELAKHPDIEPAGELAEKGSCDLR
jgi:hypothetical protein